jgi:hypothetical protein
MWFSFVDVSGMIGSGLSAYLTQIGMREFPDFVGDDLF